MCATPIKIFETMNDAQHRHICVNFVQNATIGAPQLVEQVEYLDI